MSGKIVWAVSLGFILGVFIRSFTLLTWPSALLIVCVAAIALAFFLFEKRDSFLILAILLLASSTGIVRMDLAVLEGDPKLSAHLDSKVVLVGTVVAEPDVRESSVRLHVRAAKLSLAAESVPVDVGVLVVAPRYADISYGDVIRAEGKLRLPEEFDAGSGRTFDYPMFLAKEGIVYELSFAEVERTGENRGNMLKKSVLGIKRLYLDGLGKVLPEPAAGLAAGITVGDKRSIGEDLAATFQKVSLIHIVVLSGYNMTVVINAVAHVFSFAPRYAKFALSGAIVGFFVLMTAGAASATRAGAMALIATYARLTGRQFLALRVLAVVSLVMVLWNPYVLAFDPGFQLSILATAGLILFTPIIAARLPFITERFGVREIVASTIGTQIFVLPLLLYQNGLLSLVAIPANLLTLIVVPAAMLFSFAAALLGIFFGSLASIFALPALALLNYIIGIAKILGALPYASVTIPAFGAWVMFALYVFLGIAYWSIQKKNGGP